VHEGALLELLKLFAAQAEQIRFAVALPALATNCPATQLVFATQTVLALLSSSQVLPPQGTFAVAPPAQ
jgi:hypothetical protein